MSSKVFVWVGMGIGSVVGGMIPALWGSSAFSISSLVFSSIGAIVGIYFGYKLSQ